MAVERVQSIVDAKPLYKTAAGERVPSVTTVIGLRDKPQLVRWAFGVGQDFPELRSIDAYTDDLADIGTCAHALISAHMRGVKPELRYFTPDALEAAQIPFNKYLEWEKGKRLDLLASERMYVSEEHRFGGTVDALVRINGILTVLDFKTGKKIYPEMLWQVAAYAELVREVDHVAVDEIRILQIGRVGAEGFTERHLRDWSPQWRWFLAMLEVYRAESDAKSDAKGKPSSIGDASLEAKLRASVKLLEVKKTTT